MPRRAEHPACSMHAVRQDAKSSRFKDGYCHDRGTVARYLGRGQNVGKFHPITAILHGPIGLMPFHGITFVKFVVSVGLGMGPLFVVILSRNPRWRRLAAVVTIAVWTVSVALVTGLF
jgi:hypothetical protein